MKKTFVTVLLAVLLVTAVALAENALLDAAWALVPEDAKLVEQDKDDGLYEYDFRNAEASYEVVLDPDGAPMMLQTAYSGVKGSEAAALDASAAETAALAHAGEGAVADISLLVKDGKRFSWRVFVVSGADVVEYELNAENGVLLETEVYYGAAEGLLPSALLAKLKADKGDITLTDVELELEGGVLVCSGDGTLGGTRYEFEMLTSDGTVREWKKD